MAVLNEREMAWQEYRQAMDSFSSENSKKEKEPQLATYKQQVSNAMDYLGQSSLTMGSIPIQPSGTYFIDTEINKPKSLGGSMKEYFNKHKDLIFTFIAVVLADHLLLNGALRKKIEALANKMLDNAEKKLNNEISN